MKIDLECTICRSVLRVDAEHAGKQLRCPNCGGITSIPYGTDPDLADEIESESVSAPESSRPAIPTAPYRPPAPRIEINENTPPPARPAPPAAPDGYRRQGDHFAGRRRRWDEDEYTQQYPHYAPHHKHQSSDGGGSSIFFAILGFLAIPSCYCPAPFLFAIGLSRASNASGTTAYVGNILNTVGLLIWGLTFIVLVFAG